MGNWDTEPVSLELKPEATPFHGRPYQVPISNKEKFKEEIDQLVNLKVLKKCSDSPWASPSFSIPKKNGDMHFLKDFR